MIAIRIYQARTMHPFRTTELVQNQYPHCWDIYPSVDLSCSLVHFLPPPEHSFVLSPNSCSCLHYVVYFSAVPPIRCLRVALDNFSLTSYSNIIFQIVPRGSLACIHWHSIGKLPGLAKCGWESVMWPNTEVNGAMSRNNRMDVSVYAYLYRLITTQPSNAAPLQGLRGTFSCLFVLKVATGRTFTTWLICTFI